MIPCLSKLAVSLSIKISVGCNLITAEGWLLAGWKGMMINEKKNVKTTDVVKLGRVV